MGCPGCADAQKKLVARVERLEATVAALVSGPLEVPSDPLAEEVTEAGTPRKDVPLVQAHSDVRPKGY